MTAGREISQLDAANVLSGAEVIPGDQAGHTVRMTTAQIAALTPDTSFDVALLNSEVGSLTTTVGTVAGTVGTVSDALVSETNRAIAAEAALSGGTADRLGLTPTAVKTANYTAVPGDLIPCDTTSAGFTVTLPTAPADKTVIAVKLVIQGSTNAVTIARGGSDVFNKAGGSTSLTLSRVLQSVLLQYKSSSGIWYVVTTDAALAIGASVQAWSARLDTLAGTTDTGTGAVVRATSPALTTPTGIVATDIASGTFAIGRIPTGTTSTTVPLGGVITGGSAGDASHSLALTYNAAGQLTAVTANSIAIAASQVTSGLSGTYAPIASPTFTGAATAPVYAASGLTGAVTATRYVGGVASAAPTSGTFSTGDWTVGQNGKVYICTAGGTPGTWADAGAGSGGPPTGSASGDLTGTYPGPTIAAGAVTLAKQSNAAANSFRGNNTGSPATPIDMTVAQSKSLLAIATTDVSGLTTVATDVLWDAKGDLALGTGADTAAKLTVSTAAGQAVVADPNATNKAGWQYPHDIAAANRGTTGSLASSMDRVGPGYANLSFLSTGRISVGRIFLPSGLSITNIAFFSATTALGGGSNQWFGLANLSRLVLCKTADDTSTAWAANAKKSLAVTGGPFVTTYSGWYYGFINVTATTVPTLWGVSVASVSIPASLAPITCGTADSSLTNPASCPSSLSAITIATGLPYFEVS